MAPAEWPSLNGKVKPYQEAGENLRWGSQSEGQPGWASPAGSVMSEQSLASLKAVRTNGSSPPPQAPPIRQAVPKTASGNAEVRQIKPPFGFFCKVNEMLYKVCQKANKI